MSTTSRRTHGFARPLHPFQVISWAVFTSDVVIYLVCVFALLDSEIKACLAPFFFLTVIVLIVATARATRIDSVDPFVLQKESATTETQYNAQLPFCGLCNVQVRPRSKHCRICDKCVDEFDHHCAWINNCVGKANYLSFFVTILSVAVMISTILATCCYLFVDFFFYRESFDERLAGTPVLGELPEEFYIVLLMVITVINVPLFLLDVQLVVLHLWLMSQDLTTYDYIVNEQAKHDAKRATPDDEKPKENVNRRGHEPTKPSGKIVRSLPRCMDWIIFSKCGRRKKQRIPKNTTCTEDGECQNCGSEVQVGKPPESE